MEIIIRTDNAGTVHMPTAEPSAEQATPPASVIEQAAAVGAINAGAAPARPAPNGMPPAHIAASEHVHVASGSALSAGAAPDIP